MAQTQQPRERVPPSPTIRAGMLGLFVAFLLIVPLAFAPRAEAFIYWAETHWNPFKGTIGRANLDGTGVNESFITRKRQFLSSVAVNAEHIYWNETRGPDYGFGGIAHARLDGTNIDGNLIRGAWLEALDANYVYAPINDYSSLLFEAASIGRVSLDGTGTIEKDFISGLDGPLRGIAVDANHIYWAQGVTPGSTETAAIGRAKLDGTGVEREFIPFTAESCPGAVAVDAAHVYWTSVRRFALHECGDSGYSIGRAKLDGTGLNESFIADDRSAFTPTDLAIDAAHVYWANNYPNHSIGRASLDGGSVDQRFITPAGRDLYLAVDGLTDTKLAGRSSAARTQRQTGKTIRVKVKVKAKERLTAKASGKIRVNPTYKLKPKRVKLDAGETRTLKLKPRKRAQVKKIARALKHGEKATATLKVKLTDVAANTKTEKLRVRLKR
jgi:hypothetical protein